MPKEIYYFDERPKSLSSCLNSCCILVGVKIFCDIPGVPDELDCTSKMYIITVYRSHPVEEVKRGNTNTKKMI